MCVSFINLIVWNKGEVKGLKREGVLNNFLPREKGGLSEGEAQIERGDLDRGLQ